jgi:hypothetical protein
MNKRHKEGIALVDAKNEQATVLPRFDYRLLRLALEVTDQDRPTDRPAKQKHLLAAVAAGTVSLSCRH